MAPKDLKEIIMMMRTATLFDSFHINRENMALEYTLRLATKHSPEEIIRMLSNLGFGFQNPQALRAVATGVSVIASNETAWYGEIVNETYHLKPTMYLTFRLDKFNPAIPQDWDDGLRTTIKATLEVLRETRADGIFAL